MNVINQIKNIDGLIHLPGKKIKSHQVKRLTKPGENYGSLMLSVEISVETPSGITEVLHTVAKTVPPNEFIQEIFNTPVTFRNEIAFYKKIVPLLQDFQKERGMEKMIDFTPKYYGSRLNLTGDDKVDDDAVLVLENLKMLNFNTLDSSQGLNYDVTKLILADLAHLHAVSLGFRLTKPDEFQREIIPYLDTWRSKEHNHKILRDDQSHLIDAIDELKPLRDRILTSFDTQMAPYEPREPFATITHNDCWTNNNMVKFENGTPTKNKLVDYHICSYGSPARDLVFFLFSSVESGVIEEKYDDLLKWYHENFISVLKQLKCDTEQFSFEALEAEMDFEAKNSQFGHVAFMLFPIFAEKEEVEDILELSSENMRPAQFPESLKEKFVFVVREFLRRNWI